MKTLLMLLIFNVCLYAHDIDIERLGIPTALVDIEDGEWLEKAGAVTDLETVEWAKEEKVKAAEFVTKEIKTKCNGKCYSGDDYQYDENIEVLISFSMPDQIILELSKDLYRVNGRMVIKGLYKGSFQETINKVMELKEIGVLTSIAIDPTVFDDYDVNIVPTFIVYEENQTDKLSGNVSLLYALETIDSLAAKNKLKELKDV